MNGVRGRILLIALTCASSVSCDAPVGPTGGGYVLSDEWTPPAAPVGVNVDVAVPPRVRVVDAAGRPRPGVRVVFTVVRGGGFVGSFFVDSDADGYASTTWRTGNRAGAQEVRAFVPRANSGEYVSFIVQVQAGSAATVSFRMPTGPMTRGTVSPSFIAFRDSAGNVVPAPEPVTYSSANPAIVTVAASGVVTAVQRGITVLTATSGALSDTALVVVRAGVPTVIRTEFEIGLSSWRPVFLANGQALLPLYLSTSIRRFDAAAGVLLPTSITLTNATLDLAVSADGSKAVATSQGDEVFLIDVPSNVVVRSIPVARRPLRVLVAPAGDVAYITYEGDGIARVNLSTDAVTELAVPGYFLNGLAMSPDGAALFVSTTGGRVYRIATATFSITHSVQPLGTPQGLAVSADGVSLYVARESGPLMRLRAADLTVSGTSSSPAGFFDILPTANGDYLVGVSGAGPRILDATSLESYVAFPASGQWRRLGLDPVSGAIWIGSEGNRLMRLSF